MFATIDYGADEYRTYKTLNGFKKAVLRLKARTEASEDGFVRCRYDVEGFDAVAEAFFNRETLGTPGRQEVQSFTFHRGDMEMRHTNLFINRAGRTVCDAREDIIGWHRDGIGAVELDAENDNSAVVVLSDGSAVVVTDRQCIDGWEWDEMDADGLTGAMYCDGMTPDGKHIEGGEFLYGPGATWADAFRVMLQGTPAEGAEPMGIVDDTKVYDPMDRFGSPEGWTPAIVETYGGYPLV